MNTRLWSREMLDNRLRAFGVTPEQATAFTVAADGPCVTVDIDHPAFPRGGRPTAPPSRVDAIRVTAESPAGVDARRSVCSACEYASDLGQLTVHCRKIGSRSCPRAVVRFDDARPGRCPTGRWAAGDGRALVVHTTSSGGGMGDTVVAMYAASGLARSTRRPVVYYARWSDWVARASFPGVTVRPYVHGEDHGVDLSGGWQGPYGYHKATREAKSRLWAYCRNMARGLIVPPFRGVRPVADVSWHGHHRPGAAYAVLAPFTSQWPAREWPAERWTELAHGLAAIGLRVVGVGSPNQRDRLAAVLGGVRGAEWRYGVTPDEIGDLMLGASVTVGNDSGIVHFGGLLGVPTVCVHAGSLPHEYLFDLAPSVVSVTAQGIGRGDSNAAALATIRASDVLASINRGSSGGGGEGRGFT